MRALQAMCLLASLGACHAWPPPCLAEVIINFAQSENDVVETGSGTVPAAVPPKRVEQSHPG